ncbi:MAG TPA: FtsX-like permease family protein [Candidatus Acidoferrales bacterium]|nr:FtsX-like permease family protein [Candidatus Acidoferrales bacterium]
MKFSRLILANLFRKKARLLLTIGSFAVALFLFAFLGVVNDAFTRGADVVSANRLVTINRTSIINTIPLSYQDQIAHIPGVTSVTHDNWFGGVYQDPKNFFPQFVIDSENQRKVFPELIVPDDQWTAYMKDQQGVIVGAATMKRFGWKIGERIPIKTTLYGLQDKTFQFNIDGVYHGAKPQDDETQFWIHWQYFKESVPDRLQGQVGWYTLRIADPGDAPRVSKAIDDMFANSPYETRTQTESAFAANWVKQFGNIRFLIVTIGMVVFFTLLLVTGNTMAISVRERTPEIGVLKAIGFSDRSVLGFILGESLVIAIIGCVGLVLAILVVPGLSQALAHGGVALPPLLLSPRILAYGVIAAILVGFASGILPAWGAMRMRVVNALRRV